MTLATRKITTKTTKAIHFRPQSNTPPCLQHVLSLPKENPSELVEKLVKEIQRCLQHAAVFFKMTIPISNIDFRLRGQCAGQMTAKGRFGQLDYQLRINLGLAAVHEEEFIHNVIPHEVAHLVVAVACGGLRRDKKVKPHGPEWQQVMVQCFQRKPEIYHTLELPNQNKPRAPTQTFAYTCSCRDHELSIIRHRRVILKGTKYLCRFCKEPLKPASQKNPVTAESIG